MPCHQQRKSHTQTDISATNAGKATLPYEPRMASDKTHDANCRHPYDEARSQDLLHRGTVTVCVTVTFYDSERMHASSSSPTLASRSCTVLYRREHSQNGTASDTLA